MAISEMFGRRGAGSARERTYRLDGYESESAAMAALLSGSPATLDGLTRNAQDCDVEEVPGTDTWIGVARYVRSDRVGGGGALDVGETELSFDATGGTIHMYTSLETISRTPLDGADNAPDHKGAIGVTKDGVEGVEIIAPKFGFQIRKAVADEDVDQTYIDTLYGLTGKVNDDEFLGFPTGTVLFLGAAGSKRGDGAWEITYSFAVSPDRTITINAVNVEKGGWEYLWVQFEETEDEAANRLTRRPIAAYVERVYDEGDFDGLDLAL